MIGNVIRQTVLVLVSLAVAAGCWADTWLVLEDFEGCSRVWPGTTLVNEPAHGSGSALRWEVAAAPTFDIPQPLTDWSHFDELRFWAYLPKPTDFRVSVLFITEGGYFLTDWNLDWQGWKEHRLRLADCRPVHKPVGWHAIRSIGLRAQGYGQGPVPEGLTVVFDDLALHSPESFPETTVDQWLARDRKEQVARLKATGNPYYQSIYASLAGTPPEPDLPDPDAITTSWVFSGLAKRALACAWAASFDESPLRGNDALVAHAVGLIDFCLDQQKDGSWFYSRKWISTADPNSDRFALGPLMDAVYWLRRLPGMDEHWRRWELPLRSLVDFQYQNWGHYKEQNRTDNIAWGSSAYHYPNQDVFHLIEMALAYKFWGDEKYHADVAATLDGLQAHLLPNGGFHYIGPETEIPVYHDLNIVWLARYYSLTGDARAREILEATRPYYPSVYSLEGRPEYYTDCWWKHYWTDGQATGPEIIAGLTGDRHNKWLANRLLERTGAGDTYFAIYAGMFCRNDLAEEPLPDDWITHDEGIGGPRGRFGDWYFAAVPGGGARDTFVGAMICGGKGLDPLQGALLAATLEVGQPPDAQGRNRDLFVSGPDDLTDSVILGDMAALGARYTLRPPYINSVPDRQVPSTPWRGTQVWLLTKHGLVGLLEVEATEEQTVSSLKAEVRLGPKRIIEELASGSYLAGAILARILATNFAEVTTGQARPPYAQSESQHEAIILRTAGREFTARPGDPKYYAVLVAPTDTAVIGDFERLGVEGLWAFQVRIQGQPVLVAFNPGEKPIQLQLPWSQPMPSQPQPRQDGETAFLYLAPGAVAIATAPAS